MARRIGKKLADMHALEVQQNESNPLGNMFGSGYDSDSSNGEDLRGGNRLGLTHLVGAGRTGGMAHAHCAHCHGSGFMDILKQGISFISNLFGNKSGESKQQYNPVPQKKSEPQYAHDPEFVAQGARKAHLLSVLGLPPTATKAQALAAYRKLALKYHPDKGGDVADFRRINDAKVELTGSGFERCPHCSQGQARGMGDNSRASNLRKVGNGRATKLNQAQKMGQEMSEQIHQLHGAGFWNDFADGFKRGFNSVTKPVFDVAGMIPGKIGMAANAANAVRSGVLGNDTFYGNGIATIKRGRGRPRKIMPLMQGGTGQYDGRGMEPENVEYMGFGTGGKLGENGHGQMKRKPGRPRKIVPLIAEVKEGGRMKIAKLPKPVSMDSSRFQGGKRGARTALIKKLMHGGMSMIQASKHIKTNNLKY